MTAGAENAAHELRGIGRQLNNRNRCERLTSRRGWAARQSTGSGSELASDEMDSAGDNAMHQHRHEGGEYRRIELITGVARR
jgi:hypothetical protein